MVRDMHWDSMVMVRDQMELMPPVLSASDVLKHGSHNITKPFSLVQPLGEEIGSTYASTSSDLYGLWTKIPTTPSQWNSMTMSSTETTISQILFCMTRPASTKMALYFRVQHTMTRQQP